jgi:hypothetical protein
MLRCGRPGSRKVWRDTDCEAGECEYNQRKVPIFVSRVYERRTCLRRESISSSFCLIWARRCSRLLQGENEHSSSSGEEVEGEGARETTQPSILGRTAAGSSEEMERPCEHCDGQSHFLKRQISSRLSRRTAIDLKSPAAIDGFLTQIEVRVPGSGYGCGSRGSSDHVHAPPKSNSTTAGFANAPGQAFPSPVFWVAFSYLPFPRPSPSRVPHIFAAHTYHKRLCKNDAWRC